MQAVQITRCPPGKGRAHKRIPTKAKFCVDNGDTLWLDADIEVVQTLTGQVIRAIDAHPEESIDVPKSARYPGRMLALRDDADWKRYRAARR